MHIARIIVRLLAGLLLLAAGLAGLFLTPPPMPGYAGAFTALLAQSHYEWFIAAAQIAIGIAFLANRYVPLALIVAAAFTYNSFAYHITMQPVGLVGTAILVAVIIFVGWPYRALFAPLARTTLPSR